MSRKRSEEIMRRYLTEAVMQGKWETVIPEIAAEDIWDHSQPQRGREGLKNHVRRFLSGDPKQIVIDHIIADEDKVVGIWTWRTKLTMDYLGFPPGSELECDCVSIFQLRDGMIADYQVIASVKSASTPPRTAGISNLVH